MAIIIIILPILITFVFSYNKNKEHLKKSILDDLTIMAEAYEGQVYQYLEMAKRRAQDFSTDGHIRAEMKRYASGDKGASKRLGDYMAREKLVLDKGIGRTSVVSLDGRVMASSEPGYAGADVSKEPFFMAGTRAPFITEHDFGGTPGIVIAVPVLERGDGGRPIGVLANFVFLSGLTSLLKGEFSRDLGAITWSKGKRKTMEVYLVNRDSLMLTESIFIKDSVLKTKVGTLPVDECLRGTKEIAAFYNDYRGVEVAGASMCLPLLKWTLVAEVDSAEVLAPTDEMYRDAVTGGLIASGLIGGLFVLFYRAVIRRLVTIASATARVAEGGYGATVPVVTRDEIGALSESFNRMSLEIKARADLLRESEERLRAVIDNSTAVIYLKDASGVYRLVNRRYLELFKLREGDIIGRTDADIFPADIAEAFRKNDRKVLEFRAPIEFDEQAPHGDGLHDYISVKVPIFDQAGSPIGVCGISTDITERKRMEEALRKSEEKHRTLISNIPDVVWTAAEDGRVVFASAHVTGIMGYTPEEIYASPEIWFSSVHPDDLEMVTTAYAGLFSANRVFDAEYRMRTKDGRWIWVNDRATATYEKDGARYADGVFSDITGKKLAEEKIERLKLKYEDLANNLTVGIFRATESADARFIEVNRAFVEMFEASSKEELMDMTVSSFYADPVGRGEFLMKLDRDGFVRGDEAELKTLKGRRFWGSITAVRKTKGGEAFLDGMVEDITERKKLEEQFRQAQKMEAVGQLAGGIAHDFNNILTALIGYGNLLIMKKGNDDLVRSYADHMLTLSEKAASLTQGLLAFSRKQVMNPQPTDMNDLISHIEKILKRLIGEDIEIVVSLTAEPLVVRADSTQIEHVLMNLATNARDAMPGGGRLAISTEAAVIGREFVDSHGYGSPGRYAMVVFSDTGAGMPEEVLKKVFEPFFTTKDVDKGTGLGLSMVYGIVKQHNGFIDLSSRPGAGTTFKIYIPIAEEGFRRAEPEKFLVRGGTETVLLAEDEEDVRNIAKTMLQEFGYRVITAVDGEDALARFMENKDSIALLILDIVMPKKAGNEVYEMIRAVRPEIKVIFTSGYSSDIVRSKGLAGARDFVSKPVSPSEFLKKVREVLDR